MRKCKYIKSYLDNFFLLSYSDLFRVSIDPRVKPEGDGRKMVLEDDGRGMIPEGDGRGRVPEGDRKKSVLEGNFSLLSSLRARTRGQAIFELISNFPLSKEGKNKIGMTILFCLLSSIVKAECVPTPDCASIGYTSTSCEGGFVRCPFDISKLYCVPCDTKYKYTCSDSGQIGSGDSCNGKYIECECADGGTFVNGKCPQNCTVGMIYYSDKSCSANYDSSKTVAGLVVKDNEVIMSKPVSMTWSSSYADVSGLTNITSSPTARADMNGKSNTSLIVSAFPSDTTSDNAAIYCNSYTGGINGTSGSWYLPAAGELDTYLCGNYNVLQSKASILSWSYFESYYFWSSSEYGYGSAWIVRSNDGVTGNNGRGAYNSVSCFLAID